MTNSGYMHAIKFILKQYLYFTLAAWQCSNIKKAHLPSRPTLASQKIAISSTGSRAIVSIGSHNTIYVGRADQAAQDNKQAKAFHKRTLDNKNSIIPYGTITIANINGIVVIGSNNIIYQYLPAPQVQPQQQRQRQRYNQPQKQKQLNKKQPLQEQHKAVKKLNNSNQQKPQQPKSNNQKQHQEDTRETEREPKIRVATEIPVVPENSQQKTAKKLNNSNPYQLKQPKNNNEKQSRPAPIQQTETKTPEPAEESQAQPQKQKQLKKQQSLKKQQKTVKKLNNSRVESVKPETLDNKRKKIEAQIEEGFKKIDDLKDKVKDKVNVQTYQDLLDSLERKIIKQRAKQQSGSQQTETQQADREEQIRIMQKLKEKVEDEDLIKTNKGLQEYREELAKNENITETRLNSIGNTIKTMNERLNAHILYPKDTKKEIHNLMQEMNKVLNKKK